MFDTLIESKPKKQRTAGQAAFSLFFHAALIYGAVKVTANAAQQVQAILQDTTMVFLKPPQATPPPPDQPPPDVVVTANPPPKGFQTVVAPTEIPKDIPPIDLNERPFDPRRTSRARASKVVSRRVSWVAPDRWTGEVFLEAQVDDPVAADLRPDAALYPPVHAGRPGSPARWTCSTWSTRRARPSRTRSGCSAAPTGVRGAGQGDASSKGLFKPGKVQGPAGAAAGPAADLRSRSARVESLPPDSHVGGAATALSQEETCNMGLDLLQLFGPRWARLPRASWSSWRSCPSTPSRSSSPS